MVAAPSTDLRIVGDEDSSKRRQILDGARKVFMDLGFDGASPWDIRKAGERDFLAYPTARLVQEGSASCRDAAEALSLGRVYERGAAFDRAVDCYRRAAADAAASLEVRAEGLYRLAVRMRRERRFEEAAGAWRSLLDLPGERGRRRSPLVAALRQVAAEALAIHQEHRVRNYSRARELALLALEEIEGEDSRRLDAAEHRLARLDRKLATYNYQLFG